MILHEWAQRWAISYAAIQDLQKQLGLVDPGIPPIDTYRSEAAVLNLVKIEASQKGARLWRNNVGATYTKDGAFIRFGLANESHSMNKKIKSADLIGIRPIMITANHIGITIGQFISREIKAPNWKFSVNDERAQAQLNWANLINSLGGDATFATAQGTL